jgi:Flp pilus assembly secretin CpaC
MIKLAKTVTSSVALLVMLTSAGMAEQVRVMLDRTQLITMSVQPATVVVGNPAIADANVSGNQVFINGFAPGATNIVMLDAAGAPLANLEVIVTRASTETAAVFRSGGRQSLICPDYCDPTMEIGDTDATFSTVQSQSQQKRSAALGIIGQTAGNTSNAANTNQGNSTAPPTAPAQ